MDKEFMYMMLWDNNGCGYLLDSWDFSFVLNQYYQLRDFKVRTLASYLMYG